MWKSCKKRHQKIDKFVKCGWNVSIVSSQKFIIMWNFHAKYEQLKMSLMQIFFSICQEQLSLRPVLVHCFHLFYLIGFLIRLCYSGSRFLVTQGTITSNWTYDGPHNIIIYNTLSLQFFLHCVLYIRIYLICSPNFINPWIN